MKKIALMVCVLMLFSLAACANDNGNADNNTDIVGDAADNTDGGNGAADEGGVTGGNIVPDGGEVTDNGAVGDVPGAVGNNDITNNGENGGNQTLTGTAQGYGGEVSVTVEVNGQDIVSVKVVGDNETQGIGSNAIEQMPDRIREAGSTDVEVVAGATVTSNAIKEAVDQALEGIK